MELKVLKNADKVSCSSMSGKMKYIDAVNTSPLSNDFCLKMSKVKGSICGNCYSQDVMRRYPNSQRRFDNNGFLLSQTTINPLTIPLSSDIVRLSAHGELINLKHLDNLMLLVKAHPKKTFTLWTKRVPLVTKWLKTNNKPKNLIFIRSSRLLNKKDRLPRSFDKVFTVYTKDFIGLTGDAPSPSAIDTDINCSGKKCNDCRLCYSHNKTTVINEILK